MPNMKEVAKFCGNNLELKERNPNPVLVFDDEAKEIYRYFDGIHWKAAKNALYTPNGENTASSLVQLQKWMQIFSGGQLLLEVMGGCLDRTRGGQTYKEVKIGKKHFLQEIARSGTQTLANEVFTGRTDDEWIRKMESCTEDVWGQTMEASDYTVGLDPWIFVRILSPQAYDHLKLGRQPAQITHEASLLEGVQKTLLFPAANITKAAITAAINRNEMDVVSATWWEIHVLYGVLEQAGFGLVRRGGSGGSMWTKAEPANTQEYHSFLQQWGVTYEDYVSVYQRHTRAVRRVPTQESEGLEAVQPHSATAGPTLHVNARSAPALQLQPGVGQSDVQHTLSSQSSAHSGQRTMRPTLEPFQRQPAPALARPPAVAMAPLGGSAQLRPGQGLRLQPRIMPHEAGRGRSRSPRPQVSPAFSGAQMPANQAQETTGAPPLEES